MGHDVFISYSSKDKHTADAVCAVLESETIRCWVAPRDIQPGADWGESIIDGIQGAKVFVLIFSHNANSSVQIKREVERAVNKAIPIIPFRIEEVMPERSLEYFLSTPHWLDAFTPPMESHIRYLATTIRSLLAHKPAPPPPPPEPVFKPQPWQIGAGVAAMIVAAIGWYALSPSTPSAPAGAPAPAQTAAPAPAGPSWVGKWRTASVTPTQGLMTQVLGSIAMGDMLLAAFTGPNATAEFEVSQLGQYTYTFRGEDNGKVAADRTGTLTFTSALNGKSAQIRMFRIGPENTVSMATIGARPGDSGLAFNMAGRGQMMWFGTPQSTGPLPVGQWHNQAIMAPGQPGIWTGELDISADGTYTLEITQVENGIFDAQNGQWTRTPDAGIPSKGNYAFEDNDTVNAASNVGSALWKRVN